MKNTVSYQDELGLVRVYKLDTGNAVKLLLKRDGKPFKIHLFFKGSNKWVLMKPGESPEYFKRKLKPKNLI